MGFDDDVDFAVGGGGGVDVGAACVGANGAASVPVVAGDYLSHSMAGHCGLVGVEHGSG